MNETNSGTRDRDVATLRILGCFFSIMGALVLIGTYKALGNTAATIVNVCSGLALAAVGGGMIWGSRRLDRNQPSG